MMIKSVGAEKEREGIEVQSDYEEESAKKITLLLLINIMKMFKKLRNLISKNNLHC